jgi:phage-related protein
LGDSIQTAAVPQLTDEEAAAVVAAMTEVSRFGMECARHLKGDIYEVRADADRRSFRILFAQEAKFILLSLSGFPKKTQKTPRKEIDTAETRLKEWRARGNRAS